MMGNRLGRLLPAAALGLLAAVVGGCASGGDAVAFRPLPPGEVHAQTLAPKWETPNIWPVRDPARYVSSRYGYRKDPMTGRSKLHKGLDIIAAHGSPTLSTATGVVRVAERSPSYGNYVVIDHGGGFATLYAHLSKLAVQRGQRVERGQLIGLIGATGRTTAPHLHYEVHHNGKLQDPMAFLPVVVAEKTLVHAAGSD